MTVADEPFGDSIESWKWLYAELLRVEQHWTDQVQNQQQRISTLLSVTGILLGFLAGAGFLTGALSSREWPVYLYVSSLTVLCVALFQGILALKPSIPISGILTTKPEGAAPPDLWLNAEDLFAKTDSSSQLQLVRALCASAAANARKAHHHATLLRRRALMYRQIVFLQLSLGLLVVALIGFLITGK